MARKKRDYKAEYAAAKRRATAAGYKSTREYTAVRKGLKLPPRTSPISKPIAEKITPGITATSVSANTALSRMRREAKKWSDVHSHSHRSRYSPSMSDDQLRKYHYAYVEKVPKNSRRKMANEKRERIRQYLVPDYLNQSEWESKYSPAT